MCGTVCLLELRLDSDDHSVSSQIHLRGFKFADWRWRKSGKPLDLPVDVSTSVNGAAATAEPVPDKPAKRVNPMRIQKLKDRCAALEASISSQEAAIAKFEAELAEFKSSDETLRVTKLLDDKRSGLEALMSEWEQVSGEIEAAV